MIGKKYKIGYTQGTFDMFHIGHLNLINNAKKSCDMLVVGVNADELVKLYKKKTPVVKEEFRKEIVKNIKAVDIAEIVDTLDKISMYKKYKYDVIYIGDDWKGNDRWIETEKQLEIYGVDVIYLPHTDGISSTALREEKNFAVSE